MIACSQKKAIIFSLTLHVGILEPDLLSIIPVATFSKRQAAVGKDLIL